MLEGNYPTQAVFEEFSAVLACNKSLKTLETNLDIYDSYAPAFVERLMRVNGTVTRVTFLNGASSELASVWTKRNLRMHTRASRATLAFILCGKSEVLHQFFFIAELIIDLEL